VSWRSEAACKETPTQWFFPEAQGNSATIYRKAKEVCDSCPVREQCLEDIVAIECTAARTHTSVPYGFFGGLTPNQRRPLHKAWREQHEAA
jgi:hypothetical protein